MSSSQPNLVSQKTKFGCRLGSRHRGNLLTVFRDDAALGMSLMVLVPASKIGS